MLSQFKCIRFEVFYMKNDQARAIFVGSGEDNRNGIYERISPYNHSLKIVRDMVRGFN